jgi:hypothetical protein
MRRFLIASAAAMALTLTVGAGVSLVERSGRGHDLSLLAFLAAPFALLLGAFAVLYGRIGRGWTVAARVMVAMIVGAGLGLSWTAALIAAVRPWFDTTPVPLGPLMIGGAAALMMAES